MTYQVEFTPRALEDLSALDRPIATRILQKIEWLAEHLAEVTPEPLAGRFKHLFKLRVGDWRVLYHVDHGSRRLTIHLVVRRKWLYTPFVLSLSKHKPKSSESRTLRQAAM